MEIVLGLFFVVIAAVLGGIAARLLKVPLLVGYIVSGILFGAILPASVKNVSTLAQIGTIFLLFSIGVELSLNSLTKFWSVAIFGAIIQVLLVTGFGYLILNSLGFNVVTSLVLSVGFSISSTAVLVTILEGKSEMDTIHGGVMFSWSLVQDLMVIPIMVILPLAALPGALATAIGLSLFKAVGIVISAIILGKIVVPPIIHYVAKANSRELLLLISVALALGTAAVTSLFGISPALGAFLAGVVISESQERHAVFSEIRPLRDLFVALFFVTLGFLVDPGVVVSHLPLIIFLALAVMIVKALVVFFVSAAFGFRGRTGIATSFGLAQVGEFAFVIFSSALALKLLSPESTSLGISITLITLILSPLLFNLVVPFWRKMRDLTAKTALGSLFTIGEKRVFAEETFSDHIIICGYGRVGKWVGKALGDFKIPFVVVEYNQKVVQDLKDSGVDVLYGDPTEPEVLESVGVRRAKAIVLAIPDRVAQETLVAYVQTVSPQTKIISRAHQDADWEELKTLRVDKIVQPEFEAAVEIVRSILRNTGKNKEEVAGSIKSLRLSHSR